MSGFLEKLKEIGSGCVVVDQQHSSELVGLVAGFSEEWIHWAELFVGHGDVAYLLLFFDEKTPHPFVNPFAIFVASSAGLEAALSVALREMPSENSRWALMTSPAVRDEINAFLAAHSQAISEPYRWNEQRRLH